MSSRRLVEAVIDARDCLTRAAALYAQSFEDAYYPPTGQRGETVIEHHGGQDVVIGVSIKPTNPPKSTPPPTGDSQLREVLRATVRAVAACLQRLDGKGDRRIAPIERPNSPLTADATPSVVQAHVVYACRALAWVQHHADELSDTDSTTDDGQARRRVHDACAHARTALAVWDTPPATKQMRYAVTDEEHAKAARLARIEFGTAVTPPAHYPGNDARRCRRKDCTGPDGKPRLMGDRRGTSCQACVNRDQRDRERQRRLDQFKGKKGRGVA